MIIRFTGEKVSCGETFKNFSEADQQLEYSAYATRQTAMSCSSRAASMLSFAISTAIVRYLFAIYNLKTVVLMPCHSL